MTKFIFKKGRECDLYKIEPDAMSGEIVITTDTKSIFVCFENGKYTKACSGMTFDHNGQVYSYDELVEYLFNLRDETDVITQYLLEKQSKTDTILWCMVIFQLLLVIGLVIFGIYTGGILW